MGRDKNKGVRTAVLKCVYMIKSMFSKLEEELQRIESIRSWNTTKEATTYDAATQCTPLMSEKGIQDTLLAGSKETSVEKGKSRSSVGTQTSVEDEEMDVVPEIMEQGLTLEVMKSLEKKIDNAVMNVMSRIDEKRQFTSKDELAWREAHSPREKGEKETG